MTRLWAAGWLGCLWLGSAGVAGAVPVVQAGDSVLAIRSVEGASVSVTVTGPEGFAISRAFQAGEETVLALAEGRGRLSDGLYLYDVRVAPNVGRQRGGDDAGEASLPGATAVSGSFTVRGGSVERPQGSSEAAGSRVSQPPQPDDFLINDDLVVVGSGCLGFDCINNEVFGLENLLLKQNNSRIRADDTSVTAGFPANDWQIRFNDDSSGGLNRFAIEDLTAARIPMTILAGAPNNSIFVDASGRLGVRNGAPAQVLHATTGDTPSLRLEQDGSSGFSPQTWDVSGNESSFFIRDVTGGNTLPFRIRPGAPGSAIDVLGATGNVGIGTGAAAASLHVFRNNATAQLRVEEASATAVGRNLARFVNNGAATFRFDNTQSGSGWGFGSRQLGDFFISTIGAPAVQMSLTSAGNMTITGTYASTSDRSVKDDITAVDPAEVLAKVAGLPIATWRYKDDQATHVGPMAQDFHAAFGLGADDKHIAPADMAGLGLAAIQALKAEVAEKDARIRALEQRLERLEAAQNP